MLGAVLSNPQTAPVTAAGDAVRNWAYTQPHAARATTRAQRSSKMAPLPDINAPDELPVLEAWQPGDHREREIQAWFRRAPRK